MTDKLISRNFLRHGDVLLFEHRSHQSFFVRGIRLICGSRIVHCGVIQQATAIDVEVDDLPIDYLLVLEQLAERTFEPLQFYHEDAGEVIHAVRPRKYPPKTDPSRFNRLGYGYWGIVDCLLNHLMGRITLGHWRKRRMLGLLKPNNVICSQLVGLCLGLPDWGLMEPDDYFNDSARFEYLGIVEDV